ncbi:MAG: LLM class flavin-dependent oxidoreductase [Acidimicrobiales bacterium]
MSVNLMAEAPVHQMVELARLAEEVGCRRCWVYDEGIVTRDVYVTLTAIAGNTSTIRLGPGITNPHVRHPAATAAAIASLDELSGGRTFLGIGAGGSLTLGPLGIEPRRPFTAVQEMTSALRRLFAGETVDHDGEFTLRAARLDYARGGIEIILAGRGPRMMALAAGTADGFNLSYVHKDLLRELVTGLRSGRRPGSGRFTISYSTLVATSEAEFERARAQLTFRLVDSPQRVRDMIGMTPDDVRAVRAALAEGGPSAAAHLVREEWATRFVIVGTPDEAGAELRDIMTANDIDEFQLPVLATPDAAELIERTAAMFRPEVD